MSRKFFIDRRNSSDRRSGEDQRYNPRLDLPHKRRRTSQERRRQAASRLEDFYALSEINASEHPQKGLLH